MNALVLGGSGFIGSHVADALEAAGQRVTLFDRKDSPWKGRGQRMIVGDIQNPAQVERAVKGQQVVYNFAGFSDIEEAQRHPVETVQANVLGNVIALEASRKQRVRRYLFASTVYVYSAVPSFYRASKQACEAYIEAYQRLHGVRCTILRFGSLYGPRSRSNNGIRLFLESALKRGRIDYWGTGDEMREYIHVRDAARSCVDALQPAYANRCLLLTGAQPMKIRDLLTMIREILDNKVAVRFRPGSRPDLSGLHYAMTPYAFLPREAHKMVRSEYYDLGQGLLSVLEDIQREENGPDTR